jgi:hypothetical protein
MGARKSRRNTSPEQEEEFLPMELPPKEELPTGEAKLEKFLGVLAREIIKRATGGFQLVIYVGAKRLLTKVNEAFEEVMNALRAHYGYPIVIRHPLPRPNVVSVA